MPDRVRLPGLTADAFVSDSDRWALDKLKAVPLLPVAMRKFYEVGFDRFFYVRNMASSVRCGPRQYPTLHRIMRECCEILDMPEPELYLASSPFPNAYAGGVERPYVTLLSAMVSTMDEDGLYYLMGHELGHIKANHVLYFSVYSVLGTLLEMLGRRTLGLSDVASYALILAFYEWSRQAEFSADRAGMLCAQNVGASLDSILAITSGPNRLEHEASREAFLDQARAYQDMKLGDELAKAAAFLILGGGARTHPLPVHRAKEMDRWSASGGYEAVLRGSYPRESVG